MAQNQAYTDLVDSPNEVLEVEYKSWLDLSDAEKRADLARHIAAIANYGGGVIVFGFTDDLQYAGPNPFNAQPINRDVISAIVKKHLEPTFQCDVELVTSAKGNVHTVVRIPPHGATPICARVGGPERDGKQRGIVQGTYYIRKPGPESERILTATEWWPLIRRCALHERAAILSAIDVALRGEDPYSADRKTNELQQWHDATFARFKADVTATGAPKELAERNYQLSYSILRGDGQRLDHKLLRDTLLFQLNNEVKDRVHTGWSMFYPFTRPELAPYFEIDPASGEGEEDFIECSLLKAKDRSEHSTDMWRITTGGKATLIRPYWEDEPNLNRHLGMQPGTSFGPKEQTRNVAELLRHAQAFAEKFDAPVNVSVICEWRGLAGRRLAEVNGFYPDGGRAITNSRKTTAEISMFGFDSSWPEAVSKLVAPVVRLFNSSFQVTPAFVRGQTPTWLK